MATAGAQMAEVAKQDEVVTAASKEVTEVLRAASMAVTVGTPVEVSAEADEMVTAAQKVASTAALRFNILRLAMDFVGKKPSKTKRSVGKPETLNAAKRADAPGTGITAISLLKATFTSRYPGSDTKGVPASETSATVSPDFRRLIIPGVTRSALCS